jgi:hypothetical protein
MKVDYGYGVTREDIDAAFGFDDIGVYQDGKLVKSFNSLSDDYASTNAAGYARQLATQIKAAANE